MDPAISDFGTLLDSNILTRLNRKNGHKGTKTQTKKNYYWLNSCLGVLVAKIFC